MSPVLVELGRVAVSRKVLVQIMGHLSRLDHVIESVWLHHWWKIARRPRIDWVWLHRLTVERASTCWLEVRVVLRSERNRAELQERDLSMLMNTTNMDR